MNFYVLLSTEVGWVFFYLFAVFFLFLHFLVIPLIKALLERI